MCVCLQNERQVLCLSVARCLLVAGIKCMVQSKTIKLKPCKDIFYQQMRPYFTVCARVDAAEFVFNNLVMKVGGHLLSREIRQSQG